MSKLKLTRWRLLAVLALICVCLACALIAQRFAVSAKGGAATRRVMNEKEAVIESALFARTEFFGAQALVPYPTAEARNRLTDVLEKYPNEPQVVLKLSQLDEKLGRFEEAEKELQSFVEFQSDKLAALTTL